ncbi:MAG: antibiotic biosynthesis monooxygenase [Bryobacter sp.]|jgi:quinol monooxygenase YgiN|nr:antibiotic biosynthesis monooxygenase [Bryobacter sp.]
MADRVFVVAHFTARPGAADALREVLSGFVAPTRQEQGCIQYDLCVDADAPDKFTFVEEWETRADLDAHSRSAHITAGRQKLPDLLAEPAWVQVVRKIV